MVKELSEEKFDFRDDEDMMGIGRMGISLVAALAAVSQGVWESVVNSNTKETEEGAMLMLVFALAGLVEAIKVKKLVSYRRNEQIGMAPEVD